MKKFFFVIILIVSLIGAGTPIFKGVIMEKLVKQSVDDINKMYADTGSDIVFEVNQYKRHYFSSQIEWKIKTGALKTIYGVEEIVFVNQAHHGFTDLISETSLEKNKWFMDFVNNKLEGKNPLNIRTEYRISGDINTIISLDGFLVEDGKDVIDMMPGQIEISLDKGVKNILAEIAWEGCSISEKFNIDRLSFHSKFNRISKYIWDGKIVFEINNIKANEINENDIKEKMEISKLKCDYTMDYRMEEQALSIGMGYSSDHIISAKDVIKKAFIQIGVNHMDAQGYESFMASYSQMIKSAIKAVAESHQDPALMKKTIERQMTGIGRQMLGEYEELLKKDFEIQISDFHAQLPEGKIEGDAIITFKKDVTMDKIIAIMIQPVTTLDIISLKSNISLPYILVGENPILLSPIYSGMQTGLFLKEGNNLVHKAETMNGKLFLNKKEVLLN